MRLRQAMLLAADRRLHVMTVLLLAGLLALGVFLWPASASITSMKLDNNKVSIVDSLSGGPIFQLANFKPGDQGGGEVTLSNNGMLPASLTLTLNGIADTPGQNGGLLSQVLTLTVLDITDPGSPKQIYQGAFTEGQAIDAGTLGPNGSHTFRFVVAFPDGGEPPSDTTGDNAFQGSRMTVDFTWTADGQDVDDDDPKNPQPTQPQPEQPTTAQPQAAGPVVVFPLTTAPSKKPSRCLSRRSFTIRIGEPRSRRLRSAVVVVEGRRTRAHRSHGRLVARVNLRGKTKAKVRIKITARTRAGRLLTGSRVYSTCSVKVVKTHRHGL